MPIRAIMDKHYKGVSELYRKSDGQVTGYYVTYRDVDGSPIKRRVEAKNREEALLELVEIKHEVSLNKQGKTISATLPKQLKNVLPKVAETMEDYQKMISEYKGVAVVSFIDIVDFDDINILYGYETGMRMVNEIQYMINDTLKDMDRSGEFFKHGIETFSYDLYHVYADKLCLFIKNDFNHRLLDFIVKALLRKISNHKFMISDESHIYINATFGATKAESSVSLTYAEKALEEAKKFHTNYIFHDSYSIKNEHICNNVYDTVIANIKEETVTPFFQGIFATAECTVPHKFESLMRLLDSEGRVLSPAVFMDKSKEYRLYTQLMSQMIDKVVDVINSHDVSVTLNLSCLDINNTKLCDTLLNKVKQMDAPSRLTIELVECEQTQDFERLNEFIFELKKQGLLIAIDNFGSGFSNFDTILALDVDCVKLDASLISKIHDKKYKIILENIVNICHDLGIKIIAGYISDESIMIEAQSIGVNYLQGFHLHQPQHWDMTKETYEIKGVQNA